jgi:HAD superfamily hydrolase (TIGR01509 family)
MQPKALFIDLDGTLANSMPHLFNWYQKMLKEHKVIATLEDFAQFLELEFEVSLVFLSKIIKDADPKLFFQKYIQTIHTTYLDFVQPFQDAKEFIEHSKDMGLVLFLVTNAQEHIANGFLQKHGLSPFFDQVIHLEEAKYAKPNPYLYQKALHVSGLAPDEVLAFEDSKPGILSAMQAQIRTVLLSHNEMNIEEELKNQMFKCFNDWQEAKKWLHLQQRI